MSKLTVASLLFFCGCLHAATIGSQCVREDQMGPSQGIFWTLLDPTGSVSGIKGSKWICGRVYHDLRPGGGWYGLTLPSSTGQRVQQMFSNQADAAAWVAAQPFISASAFGS